MNKHLVFMLLMLFSVEVLSAECLVLLHGLARTSSSMNELKTKLTNEGYFVVNVDYPSRTKKIFALSEIAINDGLDQCRKAKASPVNYVTHSLGGILVRQFYQNHQPSNVNRVVMLGPPNNGSEVVDNLQNVYGYELLNGPAGMELGTANTDVPKSLGPVNFELGVIAGTQSMNLILSTFLPNPDDGKVSVESAKVEGMCGFITLPVTHPFLMTNDNVIAEVIYFLKKGAFNSQLPSAELSKCIKKDITK
jgi:hypothetical protein